MRMVQTGTIHHEDGSHKDNSSQGCSNRDNSARGSNRDNSSRGWFEHGKFIMRMNPARTIHHEDVWTGTIHHKDGSNRDNFPSYVVYANCRVTIFRKRPAKYKQKMYLLLTCTAHFIRTIWTVSYIVASAWLGNTLLAWRAPELAAVAQHCCRCGCRCCRRCCCRKHTHGKRRLIWKMIFSQSILVNLQQHTKLFYKNRP